jgi:hypothetical protein
MLSGGALLTTGEIPTHGGLGPGRATHRSLTVGGSNFRLERAILNLASLCFHILTHSFSRTKLLTLVFSSSTARFGKNTSGERVPWTAR